jgi:hypothetical protein
VKHCGVLRLREVESAQQLQTRLEGRLNELAGEFIHLQIADIYLKLVAEADSTLGTALAATGLTARQFSPLLHRLLQHGCSVRNQLAVVRAAIQGLTQGVTDPASLAEVVFRQLVNAPADADVLAPVLPERGDKYDRITLSAAFGAALKEHGQWLGRVHYREFRHFAPQQMVRIATQDMVAIGGGAALTVPAYHSDGCRAIKLNEYLMLGVASDHSLADKLPSCTRAVVAGQSNGEVARGLLSPATAAEAEAAQAAWKEAPPKRPAGGLKHHLSTLLQKMGGAAAAPEPPKFPTVSRWYKLSEAFDKGAVLWPDESFLSPSAVEKLSEL